MSRLQRFFQESFLAGGVTAVVVVVAATAIVDGVLTVEINYFVDRQWKLSSAFEGRHKTYAHKTDIHTRFPSLQLVIATASLL